MPQQVDPARFAESGALQTRQAALDALGLRATGSPVHAAYVEDLAARLAQAGVRSVQTEGIPMRRWDPITWSLDVSGMNIPVVSPVAYSGSTGPAGITAQLSTEPQPGTIGVVAVGLASLNAGLFDGLDWDAPRLPAHPDGYDPNEPYERVWLSQDPMREQLARFKAQGAAGLVIVVDLPAADLDKAYLLYDGLRRDLPALFVAREEGEKLVAAATAGESATLRLNAVDSVVETHNIVGFIPGVSEELVVLHSHTDGTNGLEDNGPEAIIAMSDYLARLPTSQLPRGVLILLSTGHFAIDEAWGVESFLTTHADDIVPRIAAVITLEHLGALVSPPGRSDHVDGTYEFGCVFSTGHRPMIDTMRQALLEADVTEARVLRPFVPDLTGRSPDGTTWPGDGGPFWHSAGLPAANFITGPGYLLNVEPVVSFIDIEAFRRQAIAFTNALLALAETPWNDLHGPTEPNAPARIG